LLAIEVDSLEIVLVRKAYRQSNLYRDTELVGDMMELHDTIVDAARGFWERQVAAAGRQQMMPDGRLVTILEHGAPGMLQGMVIGGSRPCADDAESYVVEIRDGPADDRDFEDLTMLAVYRDDIRTMIILWTGRVADLAAVRKRLDRVTNGLRDWNGLIRGQVVGWSI